MSEQERRPKRSHVREFRLNEVVPRLRALVGLRDDDAERSTKDEKPVSARSYEQKPDGTEVE